MQRVVPALSALSELGDIAVGISTSRITITDIYYCKTRSVKKNFSSEIERKFIFVVAVLL